jgi:cytochrome c556
MRMQSRWALLQAGAVAGVAVAIAAAAPEQPAPPPAPAAVAPMTADDIVVGRRAAYLLSGALFADMGLASQRGTDVKDQEFAARQLAHWARTLPRMFPPDTLTAASHANPNVWTDRSGFEAKADAYAQAASKLADLAAANDKPGFTAQLTVVRSACKSCHDIYHRQEKPSDAK